MSPAWYTHPRFHNNLQRGTCQNFHCDWDTQYRDGQCGGNVYRTYDGIPQGVDGYHCKPRLSCAAGSYNTVLHRTTLNTALLWVRKTTKLNVKHKKAYCAQTFETLPTRAVVFLRATLIPIPSDQVGGCILPENIVVAGLRFCQRCHYRRRCHSVLGFLQG